MNASGKPIHIASDTDKKKIPEVTEFFVDLGLNADQVRSKVLIGDMVVLDGPFAEVGNSVVSQCLDNRVGCWAQLKALEALKHHNCEIHAVWTVQEEVGLRGARRRHSEWILTSVLPAIQRCAAGSLVFPTKIVCLWRVMVSVCTLWIRP